MLNLNNATDLFLGVTVAMFGTLGGFSFGYDTGVISGELLFIKTEFELNSFDQEILVSVTIATAMLTALASGYLGDRIGRRPCMLIGSFIFTIGAVINGFSQTSLMLIIGRGILGLGCLLFHVGAVQVMIAQ